MQYLKTATIALALLFVCVTPVSAQVSSEQEYRQSLIALIETLQQQIALLQAELDARLRVEQEVLPVSPEVDAPRFSDSVPVIARYKLAEGEATENIPYLDYRQYLVRIQEVFPEKYLDRLAEFVVFNGEDAYFDAFVETVPPDHEDWAYAVNDDVTEDADASYNTELIVHELAHVVGYDEVPGTVSPTEIDCPEYFKQTGCPLDNSYLGIFADRFWSNTDLERAFGYRETEDAVEEAEEFYDENEEEFVTSYAAVSPEEDFAESFMFFMIEEKPRTGEAREKVEFFDDFEEMRSMRTSIRRAR